jgi:hypothetical protein
VGGAFKVILTKPELPEPMVVARALAAIRKTPVQDQVQAARSSWGVIAENLEAQDGQILANALNEAGLASALVPALSPLPEAKPVVRWDPSVAEDLILIAAAGITITSTTTKSIKEGPTSAQKLLNTGILLTTGLPIHFGGKERTVEKTQQNSDLLLYLDLVYKNPARRRRLDAQQFDYSFLKERKLYFILGNFKLMLGDLARQVPAAWRNHGTKVLLENKPIPTMGYESLDDLERETRWLLTLQQSRKST